MDINAYQSKTNRKAPLKSDREPDKTRRADKRIFEKTTSERRAFRHELKYYINQGEAFLLERRLHATMDRDRFASARNGYFIRSLYFDNVDNAAVLDKIAGVERRKKYRIRIYNFKDDNIRLECKEKAGNYIHKRSIGIDRKTCDALCECNPTPLARYKHPLAQEVYIAMRSELLHPVVLVDYFRQAFVSPIEDLRVTFDKDLHTGYQSTDLFSKTVPTVSVKGDYDMILEVKFNRYLPDYFHRLIQIGSSQRSAISKYVLCRQFE